MMRRVQSRYFSERFSSLEEVVSDGLEVKHIIVFIQDVVHPESQVKPVERYGNVCSYLRHERLHELVSLVPPDASDAVAVCVYGDVAHYGARQREQISCPEVQRMLRRIRDAVSAVVGVSVIIFRETGIRIAVSGRSGKTLETIVRGNFRSKTS